MKPGVGAGAGLMGTGPAGLWEGPMANNLTLAPLDWQEGGHTKLGKYVYMGHYNIRR